MKTMFSLSVKCEIIYFCPNYCRTLLQFSVSKNVICGTSIYFFIFIFVSDIFHSTFFFIKLAKGMLLLFQKLLIIFGYGIGQTFIQIISAYLHCKKKSNFNFIRFYLKSLTELSNLENIKIT